MSARRLWNAAVIAGLVGWIATCAMAQEQKDDRGDRPNRRQARKNTRELDRPRDGALDEGVAAPDFKLKSVDGKREVKLSNYRRRQPVVLIFGSYT